LFDYDYDIVFVDFHMIAQKSQISKITTISGTESTKNEDNNNLNIELNDNIDSLTRHLKCQ